MSKTYRLNPETFEEAQERNHLKRKKKEEKEKRRQEQIDNEICDGVFEYDGWTESRGRSNE